AFLEREMAARYGWIGQPQIAGLMGAHGDLGVSGAKLLALVGTAGDGQPKPGDAQLGLAGSEHVGLPRVRHRGSFVMWTTTVWRSPSSRRTRFARVRPSSGFSNRRS